jgi:hypothetical protein
MICDQAKLPLTVGTGAKIAKAAASRIAGSSSSRAFGHRSSQRTFASIEQRRILVQTVIEDVEDERRRDEPK